MALTKNFLGNVRAQNYEELVDNMLKRYQSLGARMSLKTHFYNSHLEFFPHNLGDISNKHGKRFCQETAIMKTLYQGRFSPNMMDDYCWTLQCESDSCSYKCKSGDQKHD